jgi:alpha-L-fucosidase
LREATAFDCAGTSIYNTRPRVKYGEGPTTIGKSGGFIKEPTYKPDDIRFTRSKDGKTMYAILLGWPGNGQTVTVKSFGKGQIGEKTRIKNVELPGSAAEITWKQTSAGLEARLPDQAPPQGTLAAVLKLVL